MNQLNAYAPAIVGAVSFIVAGVSAVWIATRPPKSLRKHSRHSR
jgi:hypothetical protein